MKKAKLISLLLIIVIIGAYSLNATMDEDGVLLVPVVDDTPIIDGELDNVWKCVTATRMDSVEGGGIAVSTNNYDDHYSKFRVMYDEDYFYVFVEVVDDQLDVTAADPWNKDCIEIFFDGGNEKTFEGYDDNDVQWRWVLGQDNEDDPSGGNYAWDTTDVGFNFEIGIPVDSLEALDLALEEYHEFGFEISNNDGDDGERKEVKHWWTADGNTWQYAHLFGTGLLLSEDDREVEEFLDIQYTEDGDDIVIDGIMSEDEPWFEEGVATLSPNEVEGGMARDTLLDTDGDKDYIFKLLWDEDYLYFFYESYDDQLDVTAADPWNKDCIELFFDGGNEKTFEGYDDNDVQWRWVLGDNIDTDPSGGNFAWDTTDVGFNFEMKIP
ncbi:MAG: hypothetical protein K9M80_08645, partial [Candidatus Marinimicrobia bacterium]|nr:hypothetical protein [Candidatus Neomarinimicrobiota bacterium]